MLKISKDLDGDTFVFILEGSLAGPWVQEFRRTWEMTADSRQGFHAKVNLSGVTVVSRDGKQLLEWLFGEGVELCSSDVLTKSIVDGIARKHRQKVSNTK